MSLRTNIKKQRAHGAQPTLVKRQLACSIALLLGASFAPSAAQAQSNDPFPSCDATAYLTQGFLSRTVAVDLPSGDYHIATEYHENRIPFPFAFTNRASIDALGFNTNDGFVYGWSQFHNLPIRMYPDWSVEPLETDTLGQQRFTAGDVSTVDNKLYLYNRNGNGSGLYSVDLDESSRTYLEMNLIVSSSELNISIEDLAVHPFNGLIYAVESNGNVQEIDPTTG